MNPFKEKYKVDESVYTRQARDKQGEIKAPRCYNEDLLKKAKREMEMKSSSQVGPSATKEDR